MIIIYVLHKEVQEVQVILCNNMLKNFGPRVILILIIIYFFGDIIYTVMSTGYLNENRLLTQLLKIKEIEDSLFFLFFTCHYNHEGVHLSSSIFKKYWSCTQDTLCLRLRIVPYHVYNRRPELCSLRTTFLALF